MSLGNEIPLVGESKAKKRYRRPASPSVGGENGDSRSHDVTVRMKLGWPDSLTRTTGIFYRRFEVVSRRPWSDEGAGVGDLGAPERDIPGKMLGISGGCKASANLFDMFMGLILVDVTEV
ncbi:unnamed protein product [Calypogeia fissa]